MPVSQICRRRRDGCEQVCGLNPRVAIIGGGGPPLPKGSRDEGVHIKGKWGVTIKRMIGGWAVKRRDDAVIWLSLSHPKP